VRAVLVTWPPDKLGWTELAQAWLRLAQSVDVREPFGSGTLAGCKVDELVGGVTRGPESGRPALPINPKLAFAAFETDFK
jgi:hypothetical protein